MTRQKEDMKNGIEHSIDQAMGRKEFIAYHKTKRFLEPMYHFLEEAEDLIEQ